MTTRFNHIFEALPPWISVGPGEPERLGWQHDYFYSRPDTKCWVRRLRGWKMKSKQALMDEISAACEFFDGFGENWWAVQDCLSDLNESVGAEAYTLVIEKGEQVLCDEPIEELGWFLRIMNDTAKWWSEPICDNGPYNRKAIPFHTLIHLSEAKKMNRFAKAAVAQPELEIQFHGFG